MGAKDIALICAEHILSQKKRPLLVGITGDSGSGKSFYSQLICAELDTRGIEYSYLNADDFLISRSDREPMKSLYYEDGEFAGKSHWELLENMFRLDEFLRVLHDLKSQKDSDYHAYDRSTGAVRDMSSTIVSRPIVFIDSSMLLDQMDFLIMVDVSRQNILERKILRDADIRTPEEVVDMHTRVQGYYWDRCHPRHADIIIDNNDIHHPRIV